MRQTPVPRLRVFLLSLSILATALAFNAGLSLHGFEKIYLQSLLSRIGLEGRQMRAALENDLRFGKPLDKMLGLDRLAAAALARQPDIGDIVVALPDGRDLFAARPDLGSAARDWSSVPQADKDVGGEQVAVSARPVNGWYRLSFPLRERGKAVAGTLSLYLDQAVERAGVGAVLVASLRDLGLTLAGAAGILAVLLFSRLGRADGPKGPGRLLAGLILALGLAQAAYSLQNARLLGAQYRQLVESQAASIATFLQQDLDALLAKGLRLDKLVGIDKVFGRLLAGNPEVAAIDVQDAGGDVVYTTAAAPTVPDAVQARPLGGRAGEALGAVRVFPSRDFLEARLRGGLLDALTVAVVSFLLLSEMAQFLTASMRLRLSGAPSGADGRLGEAAAVIRPAAFLFIFAMGLSVSFLPLFMEALYKPMAGLSKDMVLGLPISAEMLFTGLSIIPCGVWLDARDWREPFYTGLAATALGSFLCYQATGPGWLLGARAVVGLGYGLTWMAMQHFVFSHTDPDSRARGFSHLVAGIYAGSLCGTAMGAILADRLGYAPVFLVAVGFTLASGLFTACCLPRALQAPAEAHGVRRMGTVRLRSLATFLADRDMMALLLLASIPFSIALVGFMFYFSTLYLRRLGVSQSDIGRVLMVYGLFMVTLAPRVSRLVDRAREKKGFIVACGLSASLGLALFFVYQGFTAVLGAILLLSLAGSLGFAAQAIYAFNARVSRRLGPGQATGWFRALERSGQMLGPLVFGQLIAVAGMERGVALAGVGFLAVTLLFWLVARKETSLGAGDDG
ncbi:MAG: MFS transporter [Solidesulfovibrio sp. DCME]|uniref:MFS transporter n=1 Tax=Solidesulfovibrio sp. DCME TaxID=3447380 RepID=UPI003D13AE06